MKQIELLLYNIKKGKIVKRATIDFLCMNEIGSITQKMKSCNLQSSGYEITQAK